MTLIDQWILIDSAIKIRNKTQMMIKGKYTLCALYCLFNNNYFSGLKQTLRTLIIDLQY